MAGYQPPFMITNRMVGLVSEIAEKIGRLGYVLNDGILFHVGIPEAVRETEKKLLAIAS